MNAFVKEFTEQNFESEAVASELPVLVDFWAPWCGPCRMVGPHIDAVAEQTQGKAVVGKVNVDENAGLAQRFGVMSIPTLVVLKGGQMVERVVGARGKEDILALLAPYMA